MAESLAGRLAPRKPPRGDGLGLRALMILAQSLGVLRVKEFRDFRVEGQDISRGYGAQATN